MTAAAASTSTLTTADGTHLFMRDWPLRDGAQRRGAILIVHGLGEHSGRYGHVAAALNGCGFHVRSFDHRGHGRSEGARGVIPRPTALLDDAQLVFDGLTRDGADAGDRQPPFLLGHSMGGAIAARAATGGMITPCGLILSSPALRVSLGVLDRLKLGIGKLLLPGLAQPNGLSPAHISRDPATVAAYICDPLVHDRISARLAEAIIADGARALADAPRFSRPTLLLVAGADKLVDPSGAREFAKRLPPGVGTLKWYDHLYHEVFNELEPDRSRVLADLVAWLASHAP